MPVEGDQFLKAKMGELIKEAEKCGKEDGKKDQGKPPRRPLELPHYRYLADKAETVQTEHAEYLRQREAEFKKKNEHLSAEIEASQSRKDELSKKISDMEQDQQNTYDKEKKRFIAIRISKEKDKLSRERKRGEELQSQKRKAESDYLEAGLQKNDGEELRKELKEDVLEKYATTYHRYQTKRRRWPFQRSS